MPSNDPLRFLPGRWRLGGAVVLALLLVVQTWLYLRSENVSPSQHFHFTQNLRDLRELDAEIDGELLANRLELSRNYDALTDFVRQVLVTGSISGLNAPMITSYSSCLGCLPCVAMKLLM